MIKEVLRQIDVVPRQVLIETIIAEIGLGDNLEFGVEWALANGGIDQAPWDRDMMMEMVQPPPLGRRRG